jgi:hypothetical protein
MIRNDLPLVTATHNDLSRKRARERTQARSRLKMWHPQQAAKRWKEERALISQILTEPIENLTK